MTPFENLTNIARMRIPGFSIRYKSQGGIWQYLPKKLRRASTYLHLPRTCWLPEKSDKPVQWRRLSHEYLHAYDAFKNYIYYLARYLFPQWLSIPVFIVALVAVLFDGVPTTALMLPLIPLLPWRSPPRAGIEKRGYTATLYAFKLQHGHIPSSLLTSTIDNMCSWIYYGMCSRATAARHMADAMTEIDNGGPAYETKLHIDGFIVSTLNDDNKPYEDIRKSLTRGNPGEVEGTDAS